MQRRERTRHLIELGGLVQKAGLVELVEDDRATLYGALLDLAAKAREDSNALALWKRRGSRRPRRSIWNSTIPRPPIRPGWTRPVNCAPASP